MSARVRWAWVMRDMRGDCRWSGREVHKKGNGECVMRMKD